MEIRYSKFNNKLNKSSNLLASVRTKIIVLLFYTIFYSGDSSLSANLRFVEVQNFLALIIYIIIYNCTNINVYVL